MNRIQTARIASLVGATGGLIQQQRLQTMQAAELAYASSRCAMRPGGIERYTPPLSCFRSVAQRSLSTPTTFLSDAINLPWSSGLSTPSFFYETLTDPTTGAIVPNAGADTLRFMDADRQQDRARIVGMVLIAMRAKVAVDLRWGGEVLPNQAFNNVDAGALGDALARLIRDYVAVAIFGTGDDRVTNGLIQPLPAGATPRAAEPWVDFTPLGYFDRPSGEFVPVPMLLWPTWNRNPNMQIGVRDADFGSLGAANPSYNGASIPYFNGAPMTAPNFLTQTYVQVSILVECLFVPPPEACAPGTWPGVLAPPSKIGNHPAYDPTAPVLTKAIAGDAGGPAPSKCGRCGCKVPADVPLDLAQREEVPTVKLSLIDPRYNLREAVKQMLLLEAHFAQAEKVCPDCIQKHCLTIEAYGEEGVSLDKDGTVAGEICGDIARQAREIERRWNRGDDRRTLARDLRLYRKTVTKALRKMTP